MHRAGSLLPSPTLRLSLSLEQVQDEGGERPRVYSMVTLLRRRLGGGEEAPRQRLLASPQPETVSMRKRLPWVAARVLPLFPLSRELAGLGSAFSSPHQASFALHLTQATHLPLPSSLLPRWGLNKSSLHPSTPTSGCAPMVPRLPPSTVCSFEARISSCSSLCPH